MLLSFEVFKFISVRLLHVLFQTHFFGVHAVVILFVCWYVLVCVHSCHMTVASFCMYLPFFAKCIEQCLYKSPLLLLLLPLLTWQHSWTQQQGVNETGTTCTNQHLPHSGIITLPQHSLIPFSHILLPILQIPNCLFHSTSRTTIHC